MAADSSWRRRRRRAARSSLRPDEVAEEEGDREDDQEDLGEHEGDDADPEADPDFLFEGHSFQGRENLSRTGADERSGGRQMFGAPGQGTSHDLKRAKKVHISKSRVVKAPI